MMNNLPPVSNHLIFNGYEEIIGKQSMIDMENAEDVELPPHAASLIEGLRDFGYSLQTSLADIIDNSITAGAKRIDILSETTTEDPWIAVVDDGEGMTRDELLEALRPGTRNPREERSHGDLGRFGLGLKSASFSQCRQLIVTSRKQGETTSAAWDLDRVAKTNKWTASLLPDPDQIPGTSHLGTTGTVVLWKKLDRIDGGFHNNTEKRVKNINAALSEAERHLRLVFHRFMSREIKQRISVHLNGRKLAPLDPFAEGHPARHEEPEEYLKLAKGVVRFRCVTLPHYKKMSSQEWDEIGGPEGHQRSQGIYVYRADRLIIAGGWLGLAKQAENTNLCRVAIDIPNSMDPDWKIDVKKASAQLPPYVRERLKNIVERFVSTSKRTYARRGRKLVSVEQVPLWNRILQDNLIVFRPDLSHPVLTEFKERLAENLRPDFDSCIRLVGASLPVETIYADMIGSVESVVGDRPDEDALRLQIGALVTKFLEAGIPATAINDTLKSVVLLKENWDRSEAIIKEFLNES